MARVPNMLRTTFSLATLLLLMCMEGTKVEAQAGNLAREEVEALREIATQLGKKDWNFSVDPCSNDSSWLTPKSNDWPSYNNTLICSCNFSGGVCHVVSMSLKSQDLDGVLPPAILKLPYLKILDLARNYLSGNIPREWASTKLEFLSFSVNHLSGPIPSYLGNITTLRYLSLENNLFSGSVPPELGNLTNLNSLILNANNLTGELPAALTRLTGLTELRISHNNFIGRIPDFFQSWKNLQTLEIQSSGLEGPIPSSISVLTNLTELRISDLQGEGSKFPSLQNMKGIKYLMLRNSNISGSVPEYVTAEMTELKILDLSFNRLGGNLNTSFDGLVSLEKMYLTSNFLTGPIPDWIKNRDSRYNIDVSYNNFTRTSVPSTCRETLNLFKSSSRGNNSITVECLGNYVCTEVRYSLHINCGGGETIVGKIKYEADEEAGGPAKYIPNPVEKIWEVSTSGQFWDVDRSNSDDYIAKNVSILRMNNAELYTRARRTPVSLTYYVRCLANGNYSVKLHFAEIVIRDNRSFYSLGRRIFDVYIQGKLKFKDFDIKKEAQAVDKVHILNFTEAVKDGTLEIRFHWAGKGTTMAPKKGTYGPLISAIDVESEFKPPDEGRRKKIIVAAAVLVPLFLILIILGTLWKKGFLGGRTSRERELMGLDLQTGMFSFRQIKAATKNFDQANKIGEGGFGSVYKGILADGTIVAVKQLSSKSKQGNREFVTEIGMISALQHPNLVRLYGCCAERNQLLLVYEYMENNSLAHSLFSKEEGRLKLDWPTRQKICIGIAKGLAFLHEGSTLKIVHRDIKTTNVLLDGDLNPKISDFGLAKLDEEENTHISTRVAGTIGYMAPEYALWGYLTYKADVYSFGVVALELVAGKNNTKFRPDENFVCLLDWALVLQQKGNLLELVDPRLGSNFNKEEVARMVQVALLCTNPSPALRPTMSAVVSMLQGRAAVHELVMDTSIHGSELRTKPVREHSDQIRQQSSSGTQSIVHSWEATWIDSTSTSMQDPYEISHDSL